MKQRLVFMATLVLLVFAAHAPALRAGFVWDDTALVLRDPLIRSPRLIAEGLQHFLFTDATSSNFYRPLQRLSYTAEYVAFIFRAGPYHLDNICLHAAAAVALFLFALAFLRVYGLEETRALAIAAIASAAWALHPLHSGVVDYVSGRSDALAAFFGFTGLYFAIRALTRDPREAWQFHALAGLVLLASALSKESGLLFLLIWIALLLLRRKSIVPALTATAFVATIYFTLRSQAGAAEVPQLTPPAPALLRPIIAARALAEYGGLLILPAKLHLDRDVETHPWGLDPASLSASAWRELETLVGVALLAALAWWLIRARKQAPAVFALLIFAALSYLPVSALFALNATIAEHWIYVPAAFLLLAAAVQLAPTFQRNHHLLVAMGIWLLFLGVRTFMRARDWKDERTFFERTVAAGGDSARMLINLGVLEMNEGHLEKADLLLHRALSKELEQPFALLNLAAVAIKRNDFVTARTLLGRAQKNRVSEAQAHEMMAVLEFKEEHKLDLLRLRLASRTGLPSWSIRQRYISALGESGQIENAIAELRALHASESYRAESWQLLAGYLQKSGQTREAAQALQRAGELDIHLSEH